MSIKSAVEEIFNQNTDYKLPIQAVNIAAPLKYLSSDLYQDSKRFVYELLQNADDSSVSGGKVRIVIKMFGECLVVAHTGKAFDDRDVRGISGIDDGTKKEDVDKTGFKGIGFKSVFGQSEKVTIFSDGEYFRFDSSFQHKWSGDWEGSQKEWETKNKRSFEMPWQIIPIYTAITEIDDSIHRFLLDERFSVGTIIMLKNSESIKNALSELAQKVNMYLFLKNVNEISFITDKTIKISIEELADFSTVLKINEIEKAKWIKRNVILEIPDETKKLLSSDLDLPEKLRCSEKVEITMSAKIIGDELTSVSREERLLYAYLPTEESEYEIPVLVNAAFYTISNRERLHTESAWNNWIFSQVPQILLEWISEFVTAKRYDAYNLLPYKLVKSNQLTMSYNSGLEKMITAVPFVLNTDGNLITVNNAIIDSTFLSEQDFFDEELIKVYVAEKKGTSGYPKNPFVATLGYSSKLKKAGVISFDWTDAEVLFNTTGLLDGKLTLDNVAKLIHYFKDVSINQAPEKLTMKMLKNVPFLLNQKNELKSPVNVFFPAPDQDLHEDSEISFVNPDLHQWIIKDFEIKKWLEDLGVDEKSDVTYLMKTIMPNASTYITPDNAIIALQGIFGLYSNDDIGKGILSQLGDLSVLTINGTLVPIKESYLSKYYHPRLALEGVLDLDIYISSEYCSEATEISNWKAFFLLLGSQEGIEVIRFEETISKHQFIANGLSRDFFNHSYTPWQTTFNGDTYRNVLILTFLDYVSTNVAFSKLFWSDVIGTSSALDLMQNVTVYWGYSGREGRSDGNKESNYLEYFIRNTNSVPATTGECLASGSIFLNTLKNKKFAKYLPVFDGPELDKEWNTFFGFKDDFELSDYLLALDEISMDLSSDNKNIREDTYFYLLDNCDKWDEEQKEVVRGWALTANFEDTEKDYLPASKLNYYADGNSNIFNKKLNFINLSRAAKNHLQIENLLALFGINIIRQDMFQIIPVGSFTKSGLKDKIIEIHPFLSRIMEDEKTSGYEEMFADLDLKINKLDVLEADGLKIKINSLWEKNVKTHYASNVLYVQRDWSKYNVMHLVLEQLVKILDAKKFAKELSLLMNSSREEIIEYFEEEGIEMPVMTSVPQYEDTSAVSDVSGENNKYEKLKIDYEKNWNLSIERNADLIRDFSEDLDGFLFNGLYNQKPEKGPHIYHFTHIENAVSILRDKIIKSRSNSKFMDSAGSEIISQTDNERKDFARFYFRPKTGTQFYTQNLGRSEDSVNRLGSDPLCPVPVFFVIPLDEAINQSDWQVSIGNLASSQVKFGKSLEVLSRFDFDGIYKEKNELPLERYMIAAHQEFLVKTGLNFEKMNFSLVVQDQQAKQSLLGMIGGSIPDLASKIVIDGTLYNNDNPKCDIQIIDGKLTAKVSGNHKGYFVLQYRDSKGTAKVTGEISKHFISNEWITIFCGNFLTLDADLESVEYKLFYCYNGVWLVDTNSENFTLDTDFIKVALEKWVHSPGIVDDLLEALKNHPELNFYFQQPIGGPDGLSLEEHTLKVGYNYLEYFPKMQGIFENESEYLICLCLHDIGKPSAVFQKKRELQHEKTLAIIEKLKEVMPVNDEVQNKIEVLINGDPIGKLLNTSVPFNMEQCCKEITDTADKLSISPREFLNSLTIYYQCDAAGYSSLAEKLFLIDDNGKLKKIENGSRFEFKEEYEQVFKALESAVAML
ncbi:DarT ssDNA thymidine ADP-ribosyltransferase family protein [Flavobacterium anhuiense]|uniref:DarT ssDNA thymidine ADP-ribosyltransferase family protein n=1 Tax=Flavobacterium anhuiense TaxID=459526 RepID=UPI000E6C4FD5|nr:DarT ssDNA thymidine ADP-ribosyltransferase family protein [Flavobacterium anhuiense]